jgi:DnaJ-class molecular chaperone
MRWRNRGARLSDEISRLRGLAPHEVLQISNDANPDEIRSAYRRLAKVYHPDKSDPFMRRYNEQVIKIINDAYHQLITNYKGRE